MRLALRVLVFLAWTGTGIIGVAHAGDGQAWTVLAFLAGLNAGMCAASVVKEARERRTRD